MSFLDKARQKAEQARQAASTGITQATSPEAREQLRQSGVQLRQGGVQVRQAAGKAGRGLVTAIEKIDPALLGDIIIKATALQEKVNLSLRDKKAAYRIGEITITATIPPQLGFTIERIGDPDNELADSRHLVGNVATAESEVVSLEAELASEDDPTPG